MKIGLNAGHTLTGPGSGAVGMLTESIETRRVSRALTQMFEAAGYEVADCTVERAASQGAYLSAAVEMANRQELDWFISIHFNSDAARKGQGVEVYTYKGRQYPDAVAVCDKIAALGFKNRGVKEGTGLYVIRKTKAKAMLIEVCFVNEPDASVYREKFDEICRAIAAAVINNTAAQTPVPPPGNMAAQTPEGPADAAKKKRYVKVVWPKLSVRRSLSWDASAVCGVVHKDEVFTVVEGPIVVGNGRMYRLKSGLFITAADKYVRMYEK